MAAFDPISALVGGALIGLASVLLMVLTSRQRVGSSNSHERLILPT